MEALAILIPLVAIVALLISFLGGSDGADEPTDEELAFGPTHLRAPWDTIKGRLQDERRSQISRRLGNESAYIRCEKKCQELVFEFGGYFDPETLVYTSSTGEETNILRFGEIR